MEDFIKVTVRFDDSNLLPAMALAAPQHQTAVQRTLTPLIYDVIQDLFRRAESESRFDERGLVRRFQESLRNVDEWDQVRRRLLIQLLTNDGTTGSNYVGDLNVAFFSRMHVLCAATPELAPLFSSAARCQQQQPQKQQQSASASISSLERQQIAASSNSLLSNNNAEGGVVSQRKQPAYRVQADCTPSSFVFAVCQAAAAYFCDDPFLFMHNVSAEQFIERRKRCLAKIDRVVEQVLFDRTTAMVSRLRKELQFAPQMHQQRQQQQPSTKSGSNKTSPVAAKIESAASPVDHSTTAPLFASDNLPNRSKNASVEQPPHKPPQQQRRTAPATALGSAMHLSTAKLSTAQQRQPNILSSERLARSSAPTVETARSPVTKPLVTKSLVTKPLAFDAKKVASRGSGSIAKSVSVAAAAASSTSSSENGGKDLLAIRVEHSLAAVSQKQKTSSTAAAAVATKTVNAPPPPLKDDNSSIPATTDESERQAILEEDVVETKRPMLLLNAEPLPQDLSM